MTKTPIRPSFTANPPPSSNFVLPKLSTTLNSHQAAPPVNTSPLTGAQLLVRTLERHGVRFVFGIPGAKIDAVFDALMDSSIRLIVCRHEQNAAFMAAAHGRLTGQPGVVLVTSGPGVTNLTTGLLTATTEGDPIVALGGAVPSNMALKASHQNTDNTKILEAVTKKSISVVNVENLQEAVTNAFRTAEAARKGAVFLSLPSDVLTQPAVDTIPGPAPVIRLGAAPGGALQTAANLLSEARFPVLFLGEEASNPRHVEPIRTLLQQTGLPAISTYQGAGVLSRELFPRFVGRVGLFKNQPGDRLLDAADVVLTIGFNPVEYDPETWNTRRHLRLIHLDEVPCTIGSCYQPEVEVLGDIAENVALLTGRISWTPSAEVQETVTRLHAEVAAPPPTAPAAPGRIRPIDFLQAFRDFVQDEDFVLCDIGTVYMWFARHFPVYRPRHLLFSNGQQTLGVALPWALATKLTHPSSRVFSVSGDGGFLFSSMELETAVREKTPFVHFVWTDGTYNMVLEQELLKYNRRSGTDFGAIDLVAYAEAFGARGHRLTSMDGFAELLTEAIASPVPVLIDVPIDYSHNRELFVKVDERRAN